MRAPLAAVLALALMGVGTPAWSKPSKGGKPAPEQEDSRARELYKQGDRAYAEGRYKEALEKFQAAHRLSGRPLLLFNIGNALERLGRFEEAADTLEKYTSYAEKGEVDVLEKRITNLRKRAEKEKQRIEEAKAREREREDARLEKELAERDAKQKSGSAKPEAKEPEKSSVPWILIGAGGAAIGAGAVFGVMALGARSDQDAACKDVSGQRLCSGDAKDAIDRDKRYSLLADIGFGVGAIAAGAGAYLLFTAPKGGEQPATALGARARAGGGEVSIVGRF
jgi:tetratricopeptide (TPR) repeat protein